MALPSSTTSKTTKRVTFHPNARVKRTLHLNDYNTEEIRATWYNREELAFIKVENQCCVETMKSGNNCTDEKGVCTRGLEALSDAGGNLKTANKNAAWEAVLDEQDYQYFEGIDEPEMIALVYFECSYRCQLEAYARARNDEREVQPYKELHLQLAKLLERQEQNQRKPHHSQLRRPLHCATNIQLVGSSRTQNAIFCPKV